MRLGTLFGGWIVFILLLGLGSTWVCASALTSGIKAATNDCGKTYPVEAVLGGDWFCPED